MPIGSKRENYHHWPVLSGFVLQFDPFKSTVLLRGKPLQFFWCQKSCEDDSQNSGP